MLFLFFTKGEEMPRVGVSMTDFSSFRATRNELGMIS